MNIQYPLKFAAQYSERREIRTAKRLGYFKSKWFQDSLVRHRTVEIAYYGGKYWLCYQGKRNTGGFDTKIEAVGWYARAGR